MPQKLGQQWEQQDSLSAQGKTGVLAAEHEVLGCGMAEAFGGGAETAG
ncbi:hypothetical protein [Streptomyces sp. TE5632]